MESEAESNWLVEIQGPDPGLTGLPLLSSAHMFLTFHDSKLYKKLNINKMSNKRHYIIGIYLPGSQCQLHWIYLEPFSVMAFLGTQDRKIARCNQCTIMSIKNKINLINTDVVIPVVFLLFRRC